MRTGFFGAALAAGALLWAGAPAGAQVAVRARTLWTMAGPPIQDGVVLIGADGKIEAVGPAASTPVPEQYDLRICEVATPGLVDVRTTVGFTGLYNVEADQDQVDSSSPIQPGLRAVDAYNPLDRLVAYVRGFGVTTAHTGHAPGELITGSTMVVKTRGKTVDEAVVVEDLAVAATLSPIAQKGGGKSPGTRAKMMEMLRSELIKAQAYRAKWARWESGADAGGDAEGADKPARKDPPARDLKMEALSRVLAGEAPLIVTANRAQDIANALRLADEFQLRLWLDMGAECVVFAEDLRRRSVPVLLHPTMYRAVGDTESLSFETAKRLADEGVAFAIQTGFEGYVPKVRVVLFEAAAAAGAGGLGAERALRAVTIDAAKILGVDARVGSLEVGKDGDVAMYDGDPFEHATHCVGVIIEGEPFGGEREFERRYP
ncbi:MAG: amidohydrolase family protein [Phycisphaerales bacterium]|nr:amidohydrolase family protein [Phycisphaerales bacterium]